MAKNVETQLPTAPLESSPMMSDSATTQAFGDSTCPIESLYEWPSREHHPGRIQDGPGVTLFENRYHDT
ncbi:hypothetical protein KIN20_021282 [Parelaphostrongylus tenuis]|uniref:Uncharacterized protein n=1 Tax=Parelaphostrongylus tenuis TaxID=148309 RepID=A0AAD5QRH8_PARTN|nr:hypothetical protein KIN20_021282 [Parelaphostrongylus tenuis]